MPKVKPKLSEVKGLKLPKTDLNGCSQIVKFRIPGSWVQNIDDWVDSPRSPYRDRDEFFRHAVYLRHRELSCKTDLERILQEFEEWTEYYEAFVKRLQSLIPSMVGLGPTGTKKAWKLLIQLRTQATQINDTYWNEVFLEHLDGCYAHLIQVDTDETVESKTFNDR